MKKAQIEHLVQELESRVASKWVTNRRQLGYHPKTDKYLVLARSSESLVTALDENGNPQKQNPYTYLEISNGQGFMFRFFVNPKTKPYSIDVAEKLLEDRYGDIVPVYLGKYEDFVWG